jgi:hypothetical protein
MVHSPKQESPLAVPKHLEAAANRLDAASARLKEVQDRPFSGDTQKEWLEALTEFCFALSDVQEYAHESVHEKLHELASAIGPDKVLLSGKPRDPS